MVNPPDGADGSPVGEEVLRVGKVLSQKFVPEPDADAILRDLLEALNRFRHNVRWKKFWFDEFLRSRGENPNDAGDESDSQLSPDAKEAKEATRRSERIRAVKAFAKMAGEDDGDEPDGCGLPPEWVSSSAPIADK